MHCFWITSLGLASHSRSGPSRGDCILDGAGEGTAGVRSKPGVGGVPRGEQWWDALSSPEILGGESWPRGGGRIGPQAARQGAGRFPGALEVLCLLGLGPWLPLPGSWGDQLAWLWVGSLGQEWIRGGKGVQWSKWITQALIGNFGILLQCLGAFKIVCSFVIVCKVLETACLLHAFRKYFLI